LAEALRPLNALVYSLCTSLWDIAGEGSKAITRQIGRELYERLIKKGLDRSSLEKALESTDEALVEKLKVCRGVSSALRDDLIEVKVSKCILLEACSMLRESGIPPIFCPYANVFLALIEDVTGSSYEIKSIEKVSEDESLITFKRIS